MSSRSCGADGGAGRGVWEVVATGLSLRAQNVSRSRSSRPKVTAVLLLPKVVVLLLVVVVVLVAGPTTYYY